MGRKNYEHMRAQKVGLRVLQRNLRKHLGLKDWSWWKLWGEVRPMLALAADEADMKEKEEALAAAKAKAEEDAKAAAELGNKVTEMLAEKEKMMEELNETAGTLALCEEKLMAVRTEKQALENQLGEALEKLEELGENTDRFGTTHKDFPPTQ